MSGGVCRHVDGLGLDRGLIEGEPSLCEIPDKFVLSNHLFIEKHLKRGDKDIHQIRATEFDPDLRKIDHPLVSINALIASATRSGLTQKLSSVFKTSHSSHIFAASSRA